MIYYIILYLLLVTDKNKNKRPNDPVDYESIDKIEFWIVDEDPECELDIDELEEILEEHSKVGESSSNVLPS